MDQPVTPLCRCKDPVCPRPHSQSGAVVVRIDFLAAWYALAATQRWIAELQEKADGPETRDALTYLRRAEVTFEAALFNRSEREVAADYRALLDEMARAAS
jgi:hypothetical protein